MSDTSVACFDDAGHVLDEGPVSPPVQPSLLGNVNALALSLNLLGQPADPNRLTHEMGGVFDALAIVRMARNLGLKARLVSPKITNLADLPLPAMMELKDGRLFILAKVGVDGALVHDPVAAQSTPLAYDKFTEVWSGRLILMATRAQLAEGAGKFGVAWFIPSVVKYRRLLGEVLVQSFFLQLFGLISPLFSQVVIDKVLVHHSLSTLDVLVFGLVVIGLFEALLGALRTHMFSHTTNRIDVELGTRMFSHLLGLPLAYFQARRVGDSVARIRELENIRNFLTGNALTLVMDLLFTLVFLGVMFSYSGLLTLIVIVSLPCYVALSLLVTPALKTRLDEKFKRGAENQAFLVENVTGVETLKAMAVEPVMQRRWEEQLAGYVSAAFKAGDLANTASQVATLISKFSTAAVLWAGAHAVINGDLTVGELIAFNMLAGRVASPVLRLAQLWQDFQQAKLSLVRLADILDCRTESSLASAQVALPPIKGGVSFDKVVFRYAIDCPEILRGISLDIQAGEAVGIVGPSGSGKRTLTKLVQRLYTPERGRVLVDGMDLALVNATSLRRQIGVVLQENMLFTGTVRDNIALANPALSFDAVIAAAKLAGAHDFILELSQGYDTVLGERGLGLSGGQRQRIAIARALVTDPRILILDEATSALDAESEHIIQANMRPICQGRTVIIIAHRLSAVRQCDRIVTIEKGEVIEQGTHEHLMGCHGRYASLWAHQMGAANVA
jgi:subfamily B ATP-binding cassette protein HlyB/CyaB